MLKLPEPDFDDLCTVCHVLEICDKEELNRMSDERLFKLIVMLMRLNLDVKARVEQIRCYIRAH